jgi:predicted nucleic acid-binding protein
MTSWVVADSGIYLATVLQEPVTGQAKALTSAWNQSGTQVAASYLFRYELVSVIRKHIARGNMAYTHWHRVLTGLLTVPVTYSTDETLLGRAYELANLYNRPATYGSMYLALAERLDCEFWTADLRLYNAVNPQMPEVRYVGHYSPKAD